MADLFGLALLFIWWFEQKLSNFYLICVKDMTVAIADRISEQWSNMCIRVCYVVFEALYWFKHSCASEKAQVTILRLRFLITCTWPEFLWMVCRWVEEDPVEILNTVRECIEKATDNLQSLEIDVHSIKGSDCLAFFLHILYLPLITVYFWTSWSSWCYRIR